MTGKAVMKLTLPRLVLAATLWALVPTDAEGCVCSVSTQPLSPSETVRKVQSQLNEALAVFVGQPVGGNILTVRLRVQSVWKGDLGAEVVMATGTEPTLDGLVRSSSCDYNFAPGETYLVFAYGKTLETMKAGACTYTTPLRYTNVPKTLDGITRRRQPSAFITPRRLVAVIGSVRSPGLIEWRERMTVADAIKLAGGPVTPVRSDVAQDRSRIFRFKITREEFPALSTSLLLPDDELFIGGDIVRWSSSGRSSYSRRDAEPKPFKKLRVSASPCDPTCSESPVI